MPCRFAFRTKQNFKGLIMKYNFLSIGGNCACIHILSNNRILEPVDNMKSKFGLGSIKAIFENGGLYKEFFEIGEIEQPFCGNHRNEKEIWYSTSNYFIIHNDFRNPFFQNTLKARIEIMNNYIKHIQTIPNNYLLYSLCEKDIDPVNFKMSENFKSGLNILRKKKLLNKLFFLMIISDDRKWYHYTCPDIYNYSNNVLEFYIKISEQKENYKSFINQFELLINNNHPPPLTT